MGRTADLWDNLLILVQQVYFIWLTNCFRYLKYVNPPPSPDATRAKNESMSIGFNIISEMNRLRFYKSKLTFPMRQDVSNQES